MEALLLSPSPEPQIPISDPANSRPNHQSEHIRDEVNDKTMKKKRKPSTLDKRKLKAKMNNNNNDDEASSSSSSTSNLNSTKRVSRVARKLRNPSVRLGLARRSVGERQAEALAYPLGMSFAAFANLVQVLERKSVAGQNVYVDDLAMISASAVKESLAYVYGDKLGSFSTNFEKSFKSTLKTLKLFNESPALHQLNKDNAAGCNLDRSTMDGCSYTELTEKETSSATPACEAIQGGARTTSPMNELVLHEDARQLSSVSRSSTMALTTFERSLEEQARANDLKRMEIGLTMRKLKLKETELALSYESNNLGKTKLEMGVSKAEFRAKKFKTELEDTRKAEMVTRIMDWLVVSVFFMLASLVYGAYKFSQQRIKEAISICEPSEEKSSAWWVPKQVSSINTEFTSSMCRLRIWVQSFFGFLMIGVFTYFIIQRSAGVKQTMPVTFIVLFLGIVCGFLGKFSVDTLGGDGKVWLLFWETFCLLVFVANVFTMTLYNLIYGPITVTQGTKSSRWNTMIPFWARFGFFFVVIPFVLPVMTGLLPFATFGEWRDHFAVLMYDFLGRSSSQV